MAGLNDSPYRLALETMRRFDFLQRSPEFQNFVTVALRTGKSKPIPYRRMVASTIGRPRDRQYRPMLPFSNCSNLFCGCRCPTTEWAFALLLLCAATSRRWICAGRYSIRWRELGERYESYFHWMVSKVLRTLESSTKGR